MKIGVELKIDVTKLDKNRFYKGEKGTYATMTTFINLDEQDQYGNNGFITQKKEKDENVELPILGNSKVFWNDNREPTEKQMQTPPAPEYDDSDSIPF